MLRRAAYAGALLAFAAVGADAQDTRSDYDRCVDPAAMPPALASMAEAQQLQLACTRVVNRSASVTSAALAEVLKVRGRLLIVLSRATATGAVDVRLARQALADYNLVLAIDPLAVDAYRIRGEIRGSLNDFKGALEDMTTAINMRPTLYDAYFARAEVFVQQNRANLTSEVAEAAIADYRKALQSPAIREARGMYVEGVISTLLPYLRKPDTQ